MPARRLLLLVVLAIGCRRTLDLGSRPHLLGKLADVDIRGDRARLQAQFPELARAADDRKDDVVDGPLTYRVWFNDADRIESFIIFVDRPLDEVLAAWGPGVAASDEPDHHVYVDTAAKIRFDVGPPPERGATDRCVVRADPLIPIATVLGTPGDVRVLDLELLNLKWSEVGPTLATRGVTLEKPPNRGDVRLPIEYAISNQFVTELGACQVHVETRASGREVVSYELK